MHSFGRIGPELGSHYEPPLTNEELKDFRSWREERNQPKRIIVGMSGASAAQYGIRLLEVLSQIPRVETHLVMSEGAKGIMRLEMDYTHEDIKRVENLATEVYDNSNEGAAIASGSFRTEGMVIIPCSVNTLEQVASASDKGLIARAAFCTLKEGKKLILVPRETPITLEYTRNLLKVQENNGIIIPPLPAFYHRPKTIEAIIDQTIGKILDQFDIEANLYKRWETPKDLD